MHRHETKALKRKLHRLRHQARGSDRRRHVDQALREVAAEQEAAWMYVGSLRFARCAILHEAWVPQSKAE